MSTLSLIGLNSEKSETLSNRLNQLLADYQIFYMNVRGFHWNIRGNYFFELHLKFEELYNDVLLKIDEIAERILTLGFTPLHSYSDYVNLSKIKETKNAHDANSTVSNTLKPFSILLYEQIRALNLSDRLNYRGISTIITGYIR